MRSDNKLRDRLSRTFPSTVRKSLSKQTQVRDVIKVGSPSSLKSRAKAARLQVLYLSQENEQLLSVLKHVERLLATTTNNHSQKQSYPSNHRT